MPQQKTKPAMRSANGPIVSPAPAEVLTLAEAAAYLRISDEDVLRLARTQGLPGRDIGEGWRFLKAAVQDWLRAPPLRETKEPILSAASSWKDDLDVEKELEEIYKRRGRPLNECGE